MGVVGWHTSHIDLIRVLLVVNQEELFVVVCGLCKKVILHLLHFNELSEVTEPSCNLLHDLDLSFEVTQTFFEV